MYIIFKIVEYGWGEDMYEYRNRNLILLSGLCFACHSRDKKHVEWVKCVNDLLTELHLYVKDHHTTGLVWSKTVSS